MAQNAHLEELSSAGDSYDPQVREIAAQAIELWKIVDRPNLLIKIPATEDGLPAIVSRVDTEIDSRLDAIGTPEATDLKGKAALANARLAYVAYQQVFEVAWKGVGDATQKQLTAARAR